jgi:hypothetical protein
VLPDFVNKYIGCLVKLQKFVVNLKLKFYWASCILFGNPVLGFSSEWMAKECCVSVMAGAASIPSFASPWFNPGSSAAPTTLV